MIKYAVIKVKAFAEETTDCEDMGIFDTEEEANEKADEAFERLTSDEKKKYAMEVGIISEDDLDDKDDWRSYSRIEIMTVICS